MRRVARLPFLLAALAMLLLCPEAARAEELADLIEKAEKSVVRINVKSAAGEAIGSGFLIDKGILATNFHVIEGAQEAYAEFADGKKLRVEGYLSFDSLRDVAILATQDIDHPTIKLAPSLPRKGDRVVAIGAPKGLSFSSSDGIVAAVRSNKELEALMEISLGHKDMMWVQTTAPISPGNSGGPLINMAGQVVGMNTMGREGGQNLNFAVSADDIKLVLDKKGKPKSFSKLPKSASKPKARPRGKPGGPESSQGSYVVTLPSGKVLDIDEIFLAQLRDGLTFNTDNTDARGARNLAAFKHPNGKIATLAIEVEGVLDGPAPATYETGDPATFANYLAGQLHGNLLTWNQAGQSVLFAQYQKGKENGLICFFKDGELWLVQEITRGKVDASHIFSDSQIQKSYASLDNPDKLLKPALAELEQQKKDLKIAEVKVKKVVKDIELNRRKNRAHATNLQKRGQATASAAQSDAASQAALQGLMSRGIRGGTP